MIRLVVFLIAIATGGSTLVGGAASAGPTRVLRCHDRIEAAAGEPRAGRDALLGPVALYRFYAAFDAARRTPPQSTPYGDYQPTSITALVREGTDVSMTVPRRERSYLRLIYRRGGAGSGPATSAAHFVACRQMGTRAEARAECGWTPDKACLRRFTEFGGGFVFDFKRARGRLPCATLTIRVAHATARDYRLFPGARCAHAGG